MSEVYYHDICEDDGKGDKSPFIRRLNEIEGSNIPMKEKLEKVRRLAEAAHRSRRDLKSQCQILADFRDRVRGIVMKGQEEAVSQIKDWLLHPWFDVNPADVRVRSEAKKLNFNKGDRLMEKTLHNSDVSGARQNVPDIKVVGNGDMFRLLCKASSQNEGWMKSTKAMEVVGGCVVQVTTQQKNLNGTYSVAEALTYVPGVKIANDENNGRKLVSARERRVKDE